MLPSIRRGPFLLWGVILVCFATAMYLCGILMVLPRYLLGMNAVLLPLNEWIVWYSGMPMTLGFALILVDLVVFFPNKRPNVSVRQDTFVDRRVTVALTAYNDELSIADAVADFRAHPMVRHVLVVRLCGRNRSHANCGDSGSVI